MFHAFYIALICKCAGYCFRESETGQLDISGLDSCWISPISNRVSISSAVHEQKKMEDHGSRI